MPSNTVADRTLLAGLSRVRKALQAALQWFSGDPTATATGLRGSVLNIWFRTNLTATQTGDTLVVDATGGSASPLTTKGDLYAHNATVDARLPVGSDGQVLIADSAQATGVKWDTLSIVHSAGCVFENGGSLLSGTLTSEVRIPFSGTITSWTIAGDVAGSASIAVSHSTYAAYDTMTALFTATCTTAKKAQATGLSYAVAAGDILRFSGSGFSAFTRCSIVLEAA